MRHRPEGGFDVDHAHGQIVARPHDVLEEQAHAKGVRLRAGPQQKPMLRGAQATGAAP